MPFVVWNSKPSLTSQILCLMSSKSYRCPQRLKTVKSFNISHPQNVQSNASFVLIGCFCGVELLILTKLGLGCLSRHFSQRVSKDLCAHEAGRMSQKAIVAHPRIVQIQRLKGRLLKMAGLGPSSFSSWVHRSRPGLSSKKCETNCRTNIESVTYGGTVTFEDYTCRHR